MKRYFIPILIATLVLTSGVLVNCGRGSFSVERDKPSLIPAATPDNQKSVPQAPRVYEKNIPHTVTIPKPGMVFKTPGERLNFRAETGNRVQGEVIVSEYYLKTETSTGNPYHFYQGFVFDPCWNVIVRSDCLIRSGQGVIRQFPKGSALHWQFAFIAANTGEYQVQAFIECTRHAYITNPMPVVGTISVTVYNE